MPRCNSTSAPPAIARRSRPPADSCSGSGSLLLEIQNHLSTKNVGHFYATEKNGSNFNLLRMNLLMHGVPYKKFTCFNEDSIVSDKYYEDGQPILFDVQVENPPYSAKFEQSSKLLDDPRYSSCGVICPQKRADLMFVESLVYHMSDDGRIAILLPSGAMYRGKKEKNEAEYFIRRHLIENLNVVDAIIGLPTKMFHGAELPVVVVVLKKKRNGNSDNILFVDASRYFKPEKKMNVITEEDIDRICNVYAKRQEIEKFSHVASIDEVRANGYNCNITRYVNSFEESDELDIAELNSEIKELNESLNVVETKLSTFFSKLESGALQPVTEDGECHVDKLTIADLFEKIRCTNKDGAIKNVITNSAEFGLIPQRDFFEKDIAVEGNTDKYTVIEAGDFVYNPRKSSSAPYGPFNCYSLQEKGIVSPLYSCLKPKYPEYTPYLLWYFRSSAWHSYIYENGNQGGARHDRVGMSDKLLKGVPVLLPGKTERENISEFFNLIEEQLRLENEKLKKMNLIKKALLQQMFV